MSTLALKLMEEQRASAVAPAGCGKTQTIAFMVASCDTGVQLILTHTHAGVQSLAKRLKSLNIPLNRYRLDTIAGWALRLARSYPQTTGFAKQVPDSHEDWIAISTGVSNLLTLPFMKRVIGATYSGVIVDEYQDCTLTQHQLILALADILPCRVLGDPLQGIFGFGKTDRLIDWESDVGTQFVQIEEQFLPYRWRGKNEQLGQWLMYARRELLNNKPLDLSAAHCPVEWIATDQDANRKVLWNSIGKAGSVIAIHSDNSNPNRCHKLASQLGGHFQSIEEMDAGALLRWATKIDNASGSKRAIVLIDFASDCCTAISTELSTIKGKFQQSTSPDFSRIRKHQEIASALTEAGKPLRGTIVTSAFQLMKQIEGSIMYRKDLWYAMLDTLNYYDTGKFQTLREAAWHARQRQKLHGRYEYQRVISRTLLVKGLEYDHAILLDAHLFDTRNLYVALTRASTSLTVVSSSSSLNPTN